MINTINQNNSYTANNKITFKAIPLATYDYMHDKAKKVIVYQLEKKDIDYVKHIINNLEKFYKKYDVDNDSARQVMEEAFNASVAILNSEKEDKARILMAFYDKEPSSILIGNALKVDKRGNFHYSSRKEHLEGETELDWLATWNKKIPKEGQATVYEYFHKLLEDGFNYCFVRSELPSKSSALKFYIKMGFKQLSKWARSIFRKNDNRYVIGEYDDNSDKIIPMLATVSDIIKTVREKAKSVLREEVTVRCSCTLPKEKFD